MIHLKAACLKTSFIELYKYWLAVESSASWHTEILERVIEVTWICSLQVALGDALRGCPAACCGRGKLWATVLQNDSGLQTAIALLLVLFSKEVLESSVQGHTLGSP